MLYHSETGFPFKVNLPRAIPLVYSLHAQQAAKGDRYGHIALESTFSTLGATVIEVETDDQTGVPVKVVLRREYDSSKDVCVVIALNSQVQGRFMVKTVWLNLKTDTHKTLNKAAYRRVA